MPEDVELRHTCVISSRPFLPAASISSHAALRLGALHKELIYRGHTVHPLLEPVAAE